MKTNVWNVKNALGEIILKLICQTPEQAAAKLKHKYPSLNMMAKIEYAGTIKIKR